jgi:hypothetical protein
MSALRVEGLLSCPRSMPIELPPGFSGPHLLDKSCVCTVPSRQHFGVSSDNILPGFRESHRGCISGAISTQGYGNRGVTIGETDRIPLLLGSIPGVPEMLGDPHGGPLNDQLTLTIWAAARDCVNSGYDPERPTGITPAAEHGDGRMPHCSSPGGANPCCGEAEQFQVFRRNAV